MHPDNTKVRETFAEWLVEAGADIDRDTFTYYIDLHGIHVVTTCTGLLIGKAGALFNKYRDIFKERFDIEVALHEAEHRRMIVHNMKKLIENT